MLVRTEAVSWCRQAVLAHGSLHRAALDSAYQTLYGRGPVPVVRHPDGVGSPWAVRRYYRGGLMRPLGDRFLRAGKPRSFVEVENSARVEALGFDTPRIVAAAVYPMGVFYRADLVTEFVSHARTLSDVLFEEDGPWGGGHGALLRREALACTANLITRLSKAGIHHRDLNAHNVLIAQDAQGVHATLLDLDGCRVAGPHRSVDAGALRRRLVRSIRKLGDARIRPRGPGERRLTTDEVNDLLREGDQT
jgi:3-deoxy-D-manno-octulosonic acid kinase